MQHSNNLQIIGVFYHLAIQPWVMRILIRSTTFFEFFSTITV